MDPAILIRPIPDLNFRRTHEHAYLVIAARVAVAFAASPAAHADNGKVIRIGVTAGPCADILRFAGELAAKEGIELKITEFTDYTVPNAALAQDDLDINNFQHQPYLDNQVAQRDTTSSRSQRASSCPSAFIRAR